MAKRKMRRFEEGGDVDPLEAANASKESQEIAGEAILKGMRDAEAAPRKAPMVTKEELAASGLSLRDYLNKQQGLTRRGESAPAAPKPTVKEAVVEKTVIKNEPSKSAGPRVGRAGQATVTEPDRAPMGGAPVNAAKQAKYRENLFDSPLVRAFKAIRERGESTAPKGYAKGGSVSASKRADGIAQRGKTRGKIC